MKDMEMGCTCNSTAKYRKYVEFLWLIFLESGNFKTKIRLACCKDGKRSNWFTNVSKIADISCGVPDTDDCAKNFKQSNNKHSCGEI
jgi:hypothetical protein